MGRSKNRFSGKWMCIAPTGRMSGGTLGTSMSRSSSCLTRGILYPDGLRLSLCAKRHPMGYLDLRRHDSSFDLKIVDGCLFVVVRNAQVDLQGVTLDGDAWFSVLKKSVITGVITMCLGMFNSNGNAYFCNFVLPALCNRSSLFKGKCGDFELKYPPFPNFPNDPLDVTAQVVGRVPT